MKTPSHFRRFAIPAAAALALSLGAPLHAQEKPPATPHMQLRPQDALKVTTAAAEANARADAFSKQGKHAEAEKEYREVVRLLDSIYNPAFPNLLKARSNLAGMLAAQGKTAGAEKEYRTWLAIQKGTQEAKGHEPLRVRALLAGMLSAQGKHAEAEKEYRELLAIRKQKCGAGHPTVFSACLDLGQCLSDQHKWKDALELMGPAETEFVALWGAAHSLSIQAKAVRKRIEAALQAQEAGKGAKQ